ncbi:O-unit flippase-like protein [Lactiplantibacillus plantarum]|uniref:O-unit flippase-like protein n=1 Tax=Lactiplantibacillus plantarum TaxID=1590 RepID=UPI0016517FEB|nr:O-unit flippase-like protein [Lactiplantibacillus plantarum]
MKKNVLWSFIGTGASMFSSFLVLPIIFLVLNTKEIGYWYLVLSINGLVTLFDFGFDPSFARNIAYVWSGASSLKNRGAEETSNRKVNLQLFSNVIAAAKAVYSIIAIIAMLLVTVAGTWYMHTFIFQQLHGAQYRISWLIFIVSIFINMYFGYVSALLRGMGEITHVNQAILISRISQIATTGLFAVLQFGIIAPVSGLLVMGLVFRMSCGLMLKKNTVYNRFRKARYKASKNNIFEILRIVWPNTWRDGLVGLSNYLLTQGTSVVSGMFLPLGMVGIYSLGIQFASAITAGANAVNNAMHPSIQMAFIQKDYPLIERTIRKGMGIFTAISVIGFVGTYFIAFPILSTLKSQTTPSFSLFLLLWIYYLIFQFISISASYIADFNIIPYVKAFLLTSILFIIQLPLGFKLIGGNVYYLVISAIFFQSYNLWKWPTFLYNFIERKKTYFEREKHDEKD